MAKDKTFLTFLRNEELCCWYGDGTTRSPGFADADYGASPTPAEWAEHKRIADLPRSAGDYEYPGTWAPEPGLLNAPAPAMAAPRAAKTKREPGAEKSETAIQIATRLKREAEFTAIQVEREDERCYIVGLRKRQNEIDAAMLQEPRLKLFRAMFEYLRSCGVNGEQSVKTASWLLQNELPFK